MPFLLAEILNFQGSTHHIGVGSFSKEDLMEAKRQILGVGENMGTEESKKIWEKNAQFWDDAMGDESNEFHREVVRPKVTELLSPDPSDYILDIACGNGNYSY